MPITYGEFTKQRRLLPLILYPDGSAMITVRTGFAGPDGEWAPEFVSEQSFRVEPAEVSAVLDTLPLPGQTRRNDLAYAVYLLLVQNGHIEAGEIT